MKIDFVEKSSKCCDICLDRCLIALEKVLRSCEIVKVNRFSQSVDNRVLPIVYRVTIVAECEGGYLKERKFKI